MSDSGSGSENRDSTSRECEFILSSCAALAAESYTFPINPKLSRDYAALNPREAEQTFHELINAPDQVGRMIESFRSFIGENQMMAYLVMMAVRLNLGSMNAVKGRTASWSDLFAKMREVVYLFSRYKVVIWNRSR